MSRHSFDAHVRQLRFLVISKLQAEERQIPKQLMATHDSKRCVFWKRLLERGNHGPTLSLQQVILRIEDVRRRCLGYREIPAHRNCWVFSKM